MYGTIAEKSDFLEEFWTMILIASMTILFHIYNYYFKNSYVHLLKESSQKKNK